jgi:hypothetical protein
MVSAAVAGTTFRPPRSYTTLWDVTLSAGDELPSATQGNGARATSERSERPSESSGAPSDSAPESL